MCIRDRRDSVRTGPSARCVYAQPAGRLQRKRTTTTCTARRSTADKGFERELREPAPQDIALWLARDRLVPLITMAARCAALKARIESWSEPFFVLLFRFSDSSCATYCIP